MVSPVNLYVGSITIDTFAIVTVFQIRTQTCVKLTIRSDIQMISPNPGAI